MCADALILTTAAGARRLRGRLPPACTILDLGDQSELPPTDALAAARDRDGGMVLTEGGPRLLGQVAADGLLDELFLTISPVLADRGTSPGPGWHGSYLFLRYAMRGTRPAAEPSGG